jgi:hypothetical protein
LLHTRCAASRCERFARVEKAAAGVMKEMDAVMSSR